MAEKIGELEGKKGVRKGLRSTQVQDHRANKDLVDMISRVHIRAPYVPISALVTATLLNDDWLTQIKEAGADIIGVGLDAASEDLFYNTRGKGTKGPHRLEETLEYHKKAREMYGPMKVNCHLIVGLGESDRELVEMFYLLKSEQIAAYLFPLIPEPGTVMGNTPRVPIARTRRIQLVKT